MPNGKTHDIINIILLIIFGAVVFSHDYFLLGSKNLIMLVIFSISYLFGTFFLSPDLDMQSTPYNRWGMLRWLWWPYKEVFKHRKMSHHIILGPFSIIGYFTLIMILILWILNKLNQIEAYHLVMYAVIVVGFVTSIEAHIVIDWISSRQKKRRYK